MLYYPLDSDFRLTLWEPHHAAELFAVVDANRDHLRRWLPWVDGTQSADDSRAFIERSLVAFGERREMHMAIWREGKLVGAIGFNRIDWDNQDCEIGYWLTQSAEGNGIITRACRVLIDHALTAWKMNRVVIEADVDNVRSRAVPERLGFTQDGTLRQAIKVDGRYSDLAVYSLLSAEWTTHDEQQPE